MKLKYCLLLSLLAFPLSSHAAPIVYGGNFNVSSPTLGDFIGTWEFTADIDLLAANSITHGFVLDGFSMTSGHSSLDISTMSAGIRMNPSGSISNIFLDGDLYSGPVHPSFDDMSLSYIFNSTLSQALGSIAGIGMDLSMTVNSGSFVESAVAETPIPAAIFFFAPSLFLLFLASRKKRIIV
ncbi:MAG: hypothetical protein COA42_05055 [Alteromonadaceae bacterium]|nr:MAG: hypothetical protein COA42_05055 [Alteromonadaceae bacterium]